MDIINFKIFCKRQCVKGKKKPRARTKTNKHATDKAEASRCEELFQLKETTKNRQKMGTATLQKKVYANAQ